MKRPSALYVLGIAAFALSIGACASTSRQTTWAEDLADGVSKNPLIAPDPAHVREKTSVEIAVPADPEQAVELLALDIEKRLLRFGRERRSLANRLTAGQARRPRQWPPKMRTLWHNFLRTLETIVPEHPTRPLPRRVLVQLRVATEAERELTERELGSCPVGLEHRITQLHRRVAQLRRSHAKGKGLVAKRGPAVDNPALNWPVSPVVFTSFFGYRRDPVNGRVRFHTGIDLGGSKGDAVTVAAAGRVVHAGKTGGYGNMVVVQHAGGLQTAYAHLSRVFVGPGARVEEGTTIGLVGASGRATGPHLHFEVRRRGVPTDPMQAVGTRVTSESIAAHTHTH